jgi:hypothetical protein
MLVRALTDLGDAPTARCGNVSRHASKCLSIDNKIIDRVETSFAAADQVRRVAKIGEGAQDDRRTSRVVQLDALKRAEARRSGKRIGDAAIDRYLTESDFAVTVARNAGQILNDDFARRGDHRAEIGAGADGVGRIAIEPVGGIFPNTVGIHVPGVVGQSDRAACREHKWDESGKQAGDRQAGRPARVAADRAAAGCIGSRMDEAT